MILRVFSCMTTHGFEGHQVVSIEEMSEVVQRSLAEDLAPPVARFLILPGSRRMRGRRKKSGLFRGLVLRLVGAHLRPTRTVLA